MKSTNCDKMILAIVQGDDYREVIKELNNNGFYATVLQSSGGFLKKTSATIMVGVRHEYLDEALGILKRHGERMEMRYKPSVIGEPVQPLSMSSVSVPVHCGGVVLFVLDVEKNERY